VKTETLVNREQDMVLEDRAARPAKRNPEAELAALRARIAEAKTVKAQGKDLHCADCFGRGRDAAIRAIEEEP
jgi:hypothetical protein